MEGNKASEFMNDVERDRKICKITTRKFANMCNIKPGRYCDIRVGRVIPTLDEGHAILWQWAGLKVEMEFGHIKIH